VSGLIFDIRRYCIHDGPGIRTTVFFKGCPMRCWWCHNPESQEMEVEPVTVERSLDGKVFAGKSAVGSRQSSVEVMKEIEKDMVFYQESRGGVTFSGGEPLMQSEFLEELLVACMKKGIHTAVDTCGYAEPSALKRVMDLVDLWLFDLKVMDDGRHTEYTGVSNELVLDNLRTLARRKKDVIIRFPVVPGATDDEQNLEAIAAKMTELKLKRIDLLPYHVIARNKYLKLEREYYLKDLEPPHDGRIQEVREFFEGKGLVVGSQ
jgi:pyruvate formate lyase activating enzyme